MDAWMAGAAVQVLVAGPPRALRAPRSMTGGAVLDSFEKMKEISRLVPGVAPEASTAQLELLLTSFADFQMQDEISVPILRTLMLLATNPKNIDALASLNGIEQLIRALRENPANLRLLQIRRRHCSHHTDRGGIESGFLVCTVGR